MTTTPRRHQASLASRLDVLQVDVRLAGKPRDGDTLAEATTCIVELERENTALRKELAEVTAAFQAVCDHEWEHVDDSFDHEYGTEVIRYQRCEKCGKTSEADDNSDPRDDHTD